VTKELGVNSAMPRHKGGFLIWKKKKKKGAFQQRGGARNGKKEQGFNLIGKKLGGGQQKPNFKGDNRRDQGNWNKIQP